MRKNLKFEEKYEILIKYYNQNGNINIKQKQIYENYPVGKWLANFREAYKNNKLPEDQVEKLNKLNMLWSDVKKVSSISLFNKKYEILKAYYEEYGNLNISTKQVYKSYPVGDYVKQFRDSYRKQGNYTFLSESQIKQLESIDMVWNPKQEKEIIKEEVPSYFIKKYKNKSSRQVIILYKYLNNIVNEEKLLNELKRIYKTEEVKALYTKAYYLYKNIFDKLKVSEKEYLTNLNENFSLTSLIIEKACKEDIKVNIEELLKTINLINISFYVNSDTSLLLEYIKAYSLDDDDIKQIFFNYSIRCKNKVYENDSKLNNKINFLLRSGSNFNNLPEEYLKEICKRNNITVKDQLKVSKLSLKYNLVLSKYNEELKKSYERVA
ncbi:helicase associated domain protein [Mycoplasma sp. CAG:611]|nr:helicase associated domain protein [Mycoplasma sp. CAG:611]